MTLKKVDDERLAAKSYLGVVGSAQTLKGEALVDGVFPRGERRLLGRVSHARWIQVAALQQKTTQRAGWSGRLRRLQYVR